MSILMCKDREIYNTNTKEVYNKQLLPGIMTLKGDKEILFNKWMYSRYSLETNSIAERIRQIGFSKKSVLDVDKTTRALSLSDCYWLKQDGEEVKFEDITPYNNDFWSGDGVYNGEAVPTIYTDGCMNKEWKDKNTLIKYGNTAQIEYSAIELCKTCGLNAVDAKLINGNTIEIKNMTNENIMLEKASQAGKFSNDCFMDLEIVSEFGLDGLKMLIVDAIVGNGDRHINNFGSLRDSNTGEYLGMAPMYDFDQAFKARGTKDILITDLKNIVKDNREYRIVCARICEAVINSHLHPIFKNRARSVYEIIQTD